MDIRLAARGHHGHDASIRSFRMSISPISVKREVLRNMARGYVKDGKDYSREDAQALGRGMVVSGLSSGPKISIGVSEAGKLETRALQWSVNTALSRHSTLRGMKGFNTRLISPLAPGCHQYVHPGIEAEESKVLIRPTHRYLWQFHPFHDCHGHIR